VEVRVLTAGGMSPYAPLLEHDPEGLVGARTWLLCLCWSTEPTLSAPLLEHDPEGLVGARTWLLCLCWSTEPTLSAGTPTPDWKRSSRLPPLLWLRFCDGRSLALALAHAAAAA
jgi:hypothetical protein